MSLVDLLPGSLFQLGALLLLVALPLQWITPHNSKISLWLSLLGGFGIAGAAGGWIGQALGSTTDQAMSWSSQLTTQLVGTSIPTVVFGVIGFVFWQKMKPSGSGLKSAGGGGKSGGAPPKKDRAKQYGGLFLAACLGTVLATIPPLAAWADVGVSATHTALASFLP